MDSFYSDYQKEYQYGLSMYALRKVNVESVSSISSILCQVTFHSTLFSRLSIYLNAPFLRNDN
jgi:hypothetical protein